MAAPFRSAFCKLSGGRDDFLGGRHGDSITEKLNSLPVKSQSLDTQVFRGHIFANHVPSVDLSK